MSNCEHSTLTFRKATASGGNNTGPNCVEVAAFTKAAQSNPSGNCVEVGQAHKAPASLAAGHCVTVSETTPTPEDHTCTPATCKTPGINPGDIVVRDSKLGEASPYVVFTPEAWRGYVATVIEAGMERDGGEYLLRDPRQPGIILHFTPDEAHAFRHGCLTGEFNFQPQYAGAAAA